MSILIDKIRIANYRAIKEIEINLSPLTMLVGANNAGKTTFLKALNLALGIDKRNISKEDFFDDGTKNPDDNIILIDIRIIPFDIETGKRKPEFDDQWAENDFSGKIISDIETQEQYYCFRTKGFFDFEKGYQIDIVTLKQWAEWNDWKNPKYEGDVNRSLRPVSIPLIFMDAQRDIQQDLKDKTSFLGKLTSHPNIPKDEIIEIEKKLQDINTEIINSSPVLLHLKEKLEELKNTINSQGEGVEILSVNKKIRDLGRNLNINFQDDNQQSFPLEYHGMGTRSWASLLTLNAYISWIQLQKDKQKNPYFPILALEEPESHLHPNAQRHLFKQLKIIPGQKIISTHSPFVASQCDLLDLRHFYKVGNELKVGQILSSEKDEEKIKNLLTEIDEDPNNEGLKRKNHQLRSRILIEKRAKINNKEKKKIEREVMNTRGELIFAKAIILFEGETEEQALPIFAEEYFKCYPFEIGFNFIGVGGNGNYSPFLSIAKFLNIPWYILSDADNDTISKVNSQIKSVFGNKNYDKVVFLNTNQDFEAFLLEDGYKEVLINAINKIENDDDFFPTKFINKFNDQKGKDDINRNYKNDSDGGEKRALLDCLRGAKTDYPQEIAEQIILKKDENGNCKFPSKIKELFDKINNDLKILK